MHVRLIHHRNETYGWHECAGCVKHVCVDLDLTVARTRRRQGGRRSRGPGGWRAPPKGITIRHCSCREALRQIAESAGKTP